VQPGQSMPACPLIRVKTLFAGGGRMSVQFTPDPEDSMNRRLVIVQIAAALACFALAGPVAAQKKGPNPAADRQELSKNVSAMIAKYRKADPNIERFFKDSAGYAVFPKVGKMGFIVAAAHGDGEVFAKGKVVGTASISLGTIGLQAGIQEFSEIIFFQNAAALDRFKQGKFEFSADVSAVIVTAGASKSANYRDGVVVFTQPTGGAMAEMSVGGQKFSFKAE
jgi:lipid-binding SYLF domain-containing protein